MTDRKEIIRGLYETREFFSYGLLGQHPTTSKYQEILTDTISMIKEREPVCVMGPDSYKEYWDREAICPDCGTHWMSYDKNGKRVTKYCPGCGRPVKWK